MSHETQYSTLEFSLPNNDFSHLIIVIHFGFVEVCDLLLGQMGYFFGKNRFHR